MSLDYYNIESMLTTEERLVKDSTKEFLDKEVKPLIVDAFQEEKPLNLRKIAPKMGSLGLIGGPVPEEYGGPGLSYIEFGLICRELERVDSSIRSFVGVQSGLCMYPIWQFGSDEQKKTWLPQIAKGKKIACFGLTEPNRGSDVAGLETVAKKERDEWVINGNKQWISEGSVADIAIVFARTDKGDIKGFLVEKGTEGFTQSFIDKKVSMRSGDVGALMFDDCRVPEDNVLPGITGQGTRQIFMCFNQARYTISWGALGAAEDCYETALKYAKDRVQFGSPIASYQLVQEKLVKMLMEITKGQLLSYHLGRMMDDKKERHQQISLAKKNNVSVARYCARVARDILGANGVTLDYSPIRHMCNIEAVYTYQGTNDIHTLILGSDITGISAFTRK